MLKRHFRDFRFWKRSCWRVKYSVE